ncbi:MAG: hypothetical protein E7260_12180 [Lachnospiraceae bacterium]|nr:hypothetical protein [Lachnospiraceae bacterium]
MLHYVEFGISHTEVPTETALCIYISGCQNRCINCHYPELQNVDAGEVLSDYFEQILDLYHEYTTCVCFMGEGDGSANSRLELLQYTEELHNRGYKACLYSGRDTVIEDWMKQFDYVKLGSYKEQFGPLTSRTTNQKILERLSDGSYADITKLFWEDGEEI